MELSRVILRHCNWNGCAQRNRERLVEILEKTENIQEFDKLFALWKDVVYNQTKPKVLLNELSHLGYNQETAADMVDIWVSEAAEVLKKSKNISASGRVQVNDVSWILGLERATIFEKAKREPFVLMKMSTDKGDKEVRLNLEEMKQLFLELKEIQGHVESVLK